MTNDELDAVVRWCLTNTERFSKIKPADDAVKLNEADEYWLLVRADRVKPGELLPASADHREKRIAAWQGFARTAFNVTSPI